MTGATANRCFGRLASPDIAGELTDRSVLCLPIGSYEQHGPHLPVQTDTVLAERFAQRVVQRWGEQYDVWLLPTIPYGLSLEHAWAPGTITLPVGVFTDLVLAVCAEYIRATPTRTIMIVNGHGGNRGILDALVYELRHRHGLNVCVTHPSSLAGIPSGSPLPEVHGGRSETSVMMVLAPDEVHLDRLPPGYAPEPTCADAIRQTILDRGVSWPWSTDDPAIATLGIVGDARGAAPELGHRIVDQAILRYGDVLHRITARSSA